MTVRLSVLDQSPMNAHAFDDMDGFPQQVMEVVGWLDRTLPEEHPYASVCVFALCAETEADELMVITITGDYASRLRSHELLAAELGLTTSPHPPHPNPLPPEGGEGVNNRDA
jgi:hypothetical protein